MIRFCCDYCAHKISVRDKDIGKRGKCPKCGNIITIPAESNIIEFLCEYCERRISVPKSHAGKKVICPQCNNTFIIPAIHAPDPDVSQDYSGDLIARSMDYPLDSSLLNLPEEYKLKDELAGEVNAYKEVVDQQQESDEDFEVEETEFVGERKLPWIVDIFLYPISKGGLSTIGIILFFRLLTDFTATGLSICCGCVGGILGLVIKVVIYYSYMYWYFTECVRDSAAGGLRAPVILASMPGLGVMIRLFFRIFSCYAFTLGPATFYRGYTYYTGIETNNVILFALLTYGMFFFPMSILAVVMFDSVNGLRPILLVRSIVSTFFYYCGLVILFYSLGVLFVGLLVRMRPASNQSSFVSWLFLFYILYNIFFLYFLLISGHLLGRFFYRFEDKLYWEV
jgi:hypothetical protein